MFCAWTKCPMILFLLIFLAVQVESAWKVKDKKAEPEPEVGVQGKETPVRIKGLHGEKYFSDHVEDIKLVWGNHLGLKLKALIFSFGQDDIIVKLVAVLCAGLILTISGAAGIILRTFLLIPEY